MLRGAKTLMNIPQEKLRNLLALAALTLILLLALWFMVRRPTQIELTKKEKTINELNQKIAAKKKTIFQGDHLITELENKTATLKRIEEQMVNGDPYLWIIRILRDFEIPKRVEFTRYDPPQIVNSVFPPNLPYQTASFVVAGNATYHDFGSFLADLENRYEHIRVHRFEMVPVASKTDTSEKLSFLLELHVLVKPETVADAAAPL
jgi:Tfp pilus assembly protein PilO